MAARTLFTSFMVANRTTRAPVSASQFLVPFGVSQIFRMAGEALHRPPDMLTVAAQTKVTAKDTFDAIQAADPTSKKRSFNPGPARNLLQFTCKGLWLFDERWAFYKAASTADTLPRPKCH